MIEQLMKIVEQQAQQHIVQNQSIPNQFNNAAIKEVSNQIFNNLKGQVNQGNMQQIIAMFQSGVGRNAAQHPVVASIIQSVTSSLAAKFTLPQDVAQGVANNLVPTVISQVIARTNDPRDIDFDLQQMMRGMSGNQSLDLGNVLGQAQKSGALSGLGNVLGKLFGK